MRRIRPISKNRPIEALVQQGLVLTFLEKQLQNVVAQVSAKEGDKGTSPTD